MRGRAILLAAGPLLLCAGCIIAALTTRSWSFEVAEHEPLYLPQLDATLTASEYHVEHHPGTAAPRDYSCRLAFASETETTVSRVSVNRPASHAGHRIYLTGFRGYQDPFRFVIRFVLRYFPFWPLVLAGIWATVAAAFGLAILALRSAAGRAGQTPPGYGRWVRLAVLPVLLLSGTLVVTRTIATGHLPFANMFEALTFWSLSLCLFLLPARDNSIPGLAVAAGLLVIVFLLPDRLTASRPLAPALISPWFTPHIAAAFLGYGGLTAAVLSPRRGPALPVGFALFTLAIAFGMVWAEQAWAGFWSWDPKETWSLVTWLLMALALVLRILGRRRTERAVSALAFASVLYNFVVVNLVLRGLHSYS